MYSDTADGQRKSTLAMTPDPLGRMHSVGGMAARDLLRVRGSKERTVKSTWRSRLGVRDDGTTVRVLPSQQGEQVARHTWTLG